MLKTWILFTIVELNLKDRVLGEVEKNIFITLLGKIGHSGLMPWEIVSQAGEIWWGVF